jgi:hypothetical protein
VNVIGLYCKLKNLPALFLTFLLYNFATPLGNISHKNRFAALGRPNQVIYNQMYSMFIPKIFHIQTPVDVSVDIISYKA